MVILFARMTKRSSIHKCECCKKSGNNCKHVTRVSSELILSDLIVCFASANVKTGMDVCTECISKAKWKRIKATKAYNNANYLNLNSNENRISSELHALNISIYNKRIFCLIL